MDPTATVIKNAVITNVGGAGFYDDVVDMIDGENMNCSSFEDACVREVCGYVLRGTTRVHDPPALRVPEVEHL